MSLARLGHPNVNVLRLVLTPCNIHFSNKIGDFCSSCVGKPHRLPSSLFETLYSSPFDMVISNIWGPAHVPTDGYVYYVYFVDAIY